MALEETLRFVDRPLREARVEWALVGSAASVMQGCAITPRDVDLLFREPAGVDVLSPLMDRFAPPTCSKPLGSDGWVSSKEAPIADQDDHGGFRWHWGRWVIGGFKVEAAHIRAPDANQGDEPGIWENGPRIWPLLRSTKFGPWTVRVPPLEVQLATCARRGLTERVEAIVRVLRRGGADPGLVSLALAGPDLAVIRSRLTP